MNILQVTIFLLAGLLAVRAEETKEVQEEAVEVLERADRALKAIRSVRYRIEATPTGVAFGFLQPTSGEVVLRRISDTNFAWFAKVDTKRSVTLEKIQLTGGFDGKTHFLVDHATKKAYEDPEAGVLGTGGRAMGMVKVAEFVLKDPLADELKATSVRITGTRTIGGVECIAVTVHYAGSEDWSVWFLSRADHLPRGRERHFTIPEGTGMVRTVVRDLELNPKLDARIFRLDLPTGFEKIDDFAP